MLGASRAVIGFFRSTPRETGRFFNRTFLTHTYPTPGMLPDGSLARSDMAIVVAKNDGSTRVKNELDIYRAIGAALKPGYYISAIAEPTITDEDGCVDELSPMTHIAGCIIKVHLDGRVETLADSVVNMTMKIHGSLSRRDAIDPLTGLKLRDQDFQAPADMRGLDRSLGFMYGDSKGMDAEKFFAFVHIEEDEAGELIETAKAVKRDIVENDRLYQRQEHNCAHPVLKVFAPGIFEKLLELGVGYGLTPQKALVSIVEERSSDKAVALKAIHDSGVGKTAFERGRDVTPEVLESHEAGDYVPVEPKLRNV